MTSPELSQAPQHSSVSLEKTIYTLDQMERLAVLQIALAGRSNVGKSSLLNCLANRKNLAKTSSVPGKTRSLNYYLVHPEHFYLVDLPGYGYARRSKSERNAWVGLMRRFLTHNKGLAGLVLVLDSRLPPQAPDREMAGMALEQGLPLLPVLTKADKCTQREIAATKSAWMDLLGPEAAPVFFSAKTRQGRELLWDQIRLLISSQAPPVPDSGSQ